MIWLIAAAKSWLVKSRKIRSERALNEHIQIYAGIKRAIQKSLPSRNPNTMIEEEPLDSWDKSLRPHYLVWYSLQTVYPYSAVMVQQDLSHCILQLQKLTLTMRDVRYSHERLYATATRDVCYSHSNPIGNGSTVRFFALLLTNSFLLAWPAHLGMLSHDKLFPVHSNIFQSYRLLHTWARRASQDIYAFKFNYGRSRSDPIEFRCSICRVRANNH